MQWAQQSVRVIDAHGRDQAIAEESPDELVRLGKDPRVLHAQAHQVVDVEESPVVDLLRGDAPERQPVSLRFQQTVQPVETAGVTRLAVQLAQRVIDGETNSGRMGGLLQSLQQQRKLVLAPGNRPGIAGVVRRQLPQRGQQGSQLRRIALAWLTCQAGKDRWNRLRIHGQHFVKVLDDEAAIPKHNSYVPPLQILSVRTAQDWNEDFILQYGIEGLPIDIEEIGVSRSASILQNILPPWIGSVPDSHVIGHNVHYQPHAALLQFRHKATELLLGADLGVQLVVVNNVVSVLTSGTRLQDGGSVAVTHAELFQVRREFARVLKAKTAIELQAVGGERPHSAFRRRDAFETIGGLRSAHRGNRGTGLRECIAFGW